jgi:hypothetical protein
MSKQKTNGVDVEALVAKTTNLPTAEVVSAALASLQKKQAEEAEKRVLGQIATIQILVGHCVKQLQQIRKREKDAKKLLQIVADAEADFLKTGDIDAFIKATEDHVYVGSLRDRF